MVTTQAWESELFGLNHDFIQSGTVSDSMWVSFSPQRGSLVHPPVLLQDSPGPGLVRLQHTGNAGLNLRSVFPLIPWKDKQTGSEELGFLGTGPLSTFLKFPA